MSQMDVPSQGNDHISHQTGKPENHGLKKVLAMLIVPWKVTKLDVLRLIEPCRDFLQNITLAMMLKGFLT